MSGTCSWGEDRNVNKVLRVWLQIYFEYTSGGTPIDNVLLYIFLHNMLL